MSAGGVECGVHGLCFAASAACVAMLAAGCDAPSARSTPDGSGHDGGVDASALLDGSAREDAGAARDAATELDAAVPPASGPLAYPYDRRHSPIDETVADALRAHAARGPAQDDDVFAKVGDSITVSTSFVHCFAGTRVDLAGRDTLAPTIAFFSAGDAAGTDPYVRESLSAGVGWSAGMALAGSPSPLDRELDAIDPRFAALMYGTNDVGFVDYDTYLRNMTEIVDRMLARGVLPVLSSIPPRDDSASADARVPAYGGLVRALAQSRGLPFVDFHRELLAIPGHGLAGDGVHPQAYSGGACVFTAAGLAYAANVRNLLVIEALDRMRRVVLEGEPAPDAIAQRLEGTGTREDPFVVPSLPFSAHADTRVGGSSAVDTWGGCSTADESGPELRYRVTLGAPATLHAALASGAGADVDVHVVRAGEDGAGCLARGDREVDVSVPAGSYDVVIDTYAGGGSERRGEGFLYVETR